ncbi:MAG: hypothetical protein GOV02_01210 [Candidatus Aenigmarchaeota archaeon]|nr:hypothetical protein [Candidatus Aenigmarchaeota archaeon]
MYTHKYFVVDMTIYVSACVIGLFAVEDGKMIAYELFSKDSEVIAKRMADFEAEKEIPELKKLIMRLKKKGKNDIVTEQPNDASVYLKENFRKLAIDLEFVRDQAELNKLLSGISISRTKTKISKLEKRDKLIIQAVSLIGDLDKILNMLTERLREWFGMHYPELRIVDHERFVKKVAKYGRRENFEEFEKSMGMEIGDEDAEMIQTYAKELHNMYVLRNDTERYLNKVVPEEIPNIAALLGNVLAARLLSNAGSLERMAKMSSSTIQLLGAEKSLFKFLKDKSITKPPKFGIIFTHPDISMGKKQLQGRIARLMASKLTIAARADFYSKQDLSEQLVREYQEKLKKIKESN